MTCQTDRKYWAIHNAKKIGPFASRNEAIDEFRKAYPHQGPEYMRASKKRQFHTGYGEFGPHFSIEWHNA